MSDETQGQRPPHDADATEPRAPAAVFQSQALQVLESMGDGFVALDRGWRIVYANREACRINRKPLEDFIGRLHWDEWPGAVGTELERQFRRVMDERVTVHFEHRYLWGPYDVWLEIDCYPLDGGISLSYRDISQRKHTEAALRRSEERYRSLVDATSQTVWTNTPEGEMRGEQPGWAMLTGQSFDEYQGYGWARAVHPDDARPTVNGWNRAVTTRTPFVFEHRLLTRDRAYRTFAVRAVPILEDDGGIREWVGVHTDVTDQREAEEAMERARRRERTIAEQLQAALLPAIPARVPGLELADFYKPALDEAGVGGDFSDVFSADKGVTYLVVGDLSGKGLAAASQVSVVRNMLRFALYNGRSLAGPVTTLNQTLAERALLNGFTTLFVGRYDAQARVLPYVNAGQEAGIVKRAATGALLSLPPTGPVLGTWESAAYQEEDVTLEPGDVLALFTDGLTEVGPTRTSLLGAEGVAALLSAMPPAGSAARVVSSLVRGVREHAGDDMGDDQCLLVALAA